MIAILEPPIQTLFTGKAAICAATEAYQGDIRNPL
jgi:hypothetical protein